MRKGWAKIQPDGGKNPAFNYALIKWKFIKRTFYKFLANSASLEPFLKRLFKGVFWPTTKSPTLLSPLAPITSNLYVSTPTRGVKVVVCMSLTTGVFAVVKTLGAIYTMYGLKSQ